MGETAGEKKNVMEKRGRLLMPEFLEIHLPLWNTLCIQSGFNVPHPSEYSYTSLPIP